MKSWNWFECAVGGVEQFPDKINYVMLHLVGYKLEYYYDAADP